MSVKHRGPGRWDGANGALTPEEAQPHHFSTIALASSTSPAAASTGHNLQHRSRTNSTILSFIQPLQLLLLTDAHYTRTCWRLPSCLTSNPPMTKPRALRQLSSNHSA